MVASVKKALPSALRLKTLDNVVSSKEPKTLIKIFSGSTPIEEVSTPLSNQLKSPPSFCYNTFIFPLTSNCLLDTSSSFVKPTATLPCW